MSGVLDFQKESRKFAKALQAEHEALEKLLGSVDVFISFLSRKDVSLDGFDLQAVEQAQDAWDAVVFQKLRTEAAHGKTVG